MSSSPDILISGTNPTSPFLVGRYIFMSTSSISKNINLFMLLLLMPGVPIILWSVLGLNGANMGVGLLVLSIVTIFFGSTLRFQLPRTKIHLTISDSLVFLAMFLYGGSAAVAIGTMESLFTSVMLRRQEIKMSGKTIAINTLIASISVFSSYITMVAIFDKPEVVLTDAPTSYFVTVLFVVGLSQFVVNSVLVSAYVAIKTAEVTMWKVWNEYCLNALAMFLFGALMAGLITKALQQIDFFLFAAVAILFSLVYLTYSRYVNDIKTTAAEAQESERRRAEQAETHVNELHHFVDELKRSSEALTESREKFKYAVYHDELTDLPNRSYFIERISLLLEDQTRPINNRIAVMFLDLDRFKTLNDSLGHSVGDQLIKHVAIRLKNIVGEDGCVGRFGGDEFAILIETNTAESNLTALASKIRDEVAEPFLVDGRHIHTNVSIGIAFQDERYATAQDLLRNADIAMYHAKKEHSGVTVFDPDMHTTAVSLLQLETDMHTAIKEKQFELFYQPIVELTSKKIIGFEALIRWPHPKLGIISPTDFIYLAETTGQIVPITIQILKDACRQIKKWHDLTGENYIVSVNISSRHFEHAGLVDQVENVLRETKILPRCLKLEITESAVMQNAEFAISTLKRIKETGVRISIDDFGTGYSSLSYLHKFPIDTLKIDRSFVASMEDGSENGEIVKTIMALAHALNFDVVAEGIETVEQYVQLKHLGCEYGQGFLFTRPLPVVEIEKMLWSSSPWSDILPAADYNELEQNSLFH